MNSSISNKINSVLNNFQDMNFHSILLCVQQSIDQKNQQILKKQDVEIFIQQNFLSQCQNFLKQNQQLHNFCKKISRRADQIASQIEKIQKYIQIKTSVDLQVNVRKLLQKSKLNKQREVILRKLCDYILIPENLTNKIVDSNERIDQQFFKAVQLIQNQKLLINTVEAFGDNKLSQSLKKNYSSLYNLGLSKAIKSIKIIGQIQDINLLKKFKNFVQQSQQHKNKFKETLINTRIQLNKNYFMPLLNKMNYSLKMQLQQYYKQILPQITLRFQTQKKFIKQIYHDPAEQTQILEKLFNSFLPEIYYKLQRSFYKTFQFLTLVKIKNCYHVHQLDFKKIVSPEHKMSHILLSFSKLNKCIQSALILAAEKLIEYKYNIYSISSYMILTQHLRSVYEAYGYDKQYNKQGLEIWLSAFYKFSNSRAYNDTNKSLVIFNLNIWEIYKNIWYNENIVYNNENMNQKCQKTLEVCKNIFIRMNIQLIRQKLISNEIEKKNKKQLLSILLDMFSQDYKKIIFSQLSLIVHQQIRHPIKTELINKFLQEYNKIINIIQPQNNESLKILCNNQGVNIKRLGKQADKVQILNSMQIKSYLEH